MNNQDVKSQRRRQQQQQQPKRQDPRRSTTNGNSKSSDAGKLQQHHQTPTRNSNNNSRCGPSPALPAPVSVELYNLFPFCSLKSSFPSSASLVQQALEDYVTATAAAAAASSQAPDAIAPSSPPSSPLFSKSFFYHRPEHNSSLLYPIRLEIVIREEPSDANENVSSNNNETAITTTTTTTTAITTSERVLLSRIDDTLTVRPTWHHLNETNISSSNHESKNDLYEATLDYRKYESMFFRFSVVKESEEEEVEHGPKIIQSPPCCFLQIPAHPSKLIRIWKVDGNNAIISGSQLLPPCLPINTVLVRYSDGSIRIQPSLYQLLLENNPEDDFLHYPILKNNDYTSASGANSVSNGFTTMDRLLDKTPPRSVTKTMSTTTVTTTSKSLALENFARFEDDVFRTLDTVASSKPASAAVSSSSSASSFKSSEKDEQGGESPASSSSSCGSDTQADPHQLCSSDINCDNTNDFGPSFEEFQRQQEQVLKEQNDMIEQLVQQERIALEDELQAAKIVMCNGHDGDDSDKSPVTLMTQQLREQTCQVEAATHSEEKECQRLEFLVLAQQVRMLRELRAIYPISRRSRPGLVRGGAQPPPNSANRSSSSDNDAFTIRGLPIPHPGMDLFAGTTMTTSYYAATLTSAIISEDDLSAALGYLCHVVFMLSKYLTVPLRYRLICNSSRSAVQDEDCQSDYYNHAAAGGAMPLSSLPASSGSSNSGVGTTNSGNKKALLFPLFQARPIEREQVEHGVLLLERNVECLCKARGIRFDPHSHVLAKVNRIYECIVDGKP